MRVACIDCPLTAPSDPSRILKWDDPVDKLVGCDEVFLTTKTAELEDWGGYAHSMRVESIHARRSETNTDDLLETDERPEEVQALKLMAQRGR